MTKGNPSCIEFFILDWSLKNGYAGLLARGNMLEQNRAKRLVFDFKSKTNHSKFKVIHSPQKIQQNSARKQINFILPSHSRKFE